MRIQVHVNDTLGHSLNDAAKAKGVSLNNEVKQRLGASLVGTDDAEKLVKHIAKTLASAYVLGENGNNFKDPERVDSLWMGFVPMARASLAMTPIESQPIPERYTREPIGSEKEN